MSIQPILIIAKEEWRYWRRSRLGIIAGLALLLIVIASTTSTIVQVEAERSLRENFQTSAEETFKEQPDRHPHRMVHYGHYVFRAPAPLAIIDPGVDVHTGTIMFLEGHRQNSAVFSPRYAAAQAGPFAELTPAFAYQILVPLLLVIIGFATISREREGKTDYLLVSSAVSPIALWLGKTLALTSVALVALLPLAGGLVFGVLQGESAGIAVVFFLGYLVYLACWSSLITAVSAWTRNSSLSLSLLLASWVLLCVIMPRLASTVASAAIPLDGKIVKDLEMTRALRELGDGHNANDPAFEKLRAQLLEKYEVDDIEDLPVNFRGVVASTSEANLTEVLNEFADERMEQEMAQSNLVRWMSPLSPALAAKSFSVQLASTDLKQHHRFLRDAEALRFDFVQKLNQLHVEDLAYEDDIRRSEGKEANLRARVSAANWRMLETFPWQPNSTSDRMAESAPQLLILLFWWMGAALFGASGTQRLFREK